MALFATYFPRIALRHVHYLWYKTRGYAVRAEGLHFSAFHCYIDADYNGGALKEMSHCQLHQVLQWCLRQLLDRDKWSSPGLLHLWLCMNTSLATPSLAPSLPPPSPSLPPSQDHSQWQGSLQTPPTHANNGLGSGPPAHTNFTTLQDCKWVYIAQVYLCRYIRNNVTECKFFFCADSYFQTAVGEVVTYSEWIVSSITHI